MQRLSNYLLKLSRGAMERPAYDFKDWALSEAKSLIPFDSCVWLMGNWINETPVVHTAHLHNLSGNFVESWMRFQHEDRLARDVTLHSNHTFNVDVMREYENTDIYDVKQRAKLSRFGVETASNSFHPSMCEFRSNLDTHSTANWTAIPAQTGH